MGSHDAASMTGAQNHGTSSLRASASLTNCPLDILLGILGRLDLRDTFSFLSVCTAFRNMARHRSLWIDTLRRTERVRPLPFPVGTEISRLNLVELRRVAWRAHCLEKNWSSECLRPGRAVDSFIGGSEGLQYPHIVSVIPGASLVLIYQEDLRSLALCRSDADGSVRVVKRTDLGRLRRSAQYDKLGVHLVALLIDTGQESDENRRSLRVLGVEYEADDANVEEYFSAPLTPTCQSLFIWEDVVGVIPYPDGGTSLHIHATNFVTNVSVTVSIDVGFPMVRHSYHACHVCDGALHITIDAGDSKLEVHRCPMDRFPLADSHPLEADSVQVERTDALMKVVDIDSKEYSGEELSIIKVWWSPLGLHVISATRFDQWDSDTEFHFWPTEEDTPATQWLEGGPESCHERGWPTWVMAVSPSGNYAVVIVRWSPYRVAPPRYSLYLMEFLADPIRIRKHRLDLPYVAYWGHKYEVYCFSSVGIDERCGVVYVARTDGHLFRTSYIR